MEDGTLAQKIKAARVASNLSTDEAAQAMGVTRQTYYMRELHPEEFRLSELLGLYSSMNSVGKDIARSAVSDLFFLD